MTTWTRVRDKATGHHYSVAVVDPERHEVLKQAAVDRKGKPLPAKPKVSVDKAGETNKATSAAKEDKKS